MSPAVSVDGEVLDLPHHVRARRLLANVQNTECIPWVARYATVTHSFCDKVTKKPRRGPYCGANSPMPVPLRSW